MKGNMGKTIQYLRESKGFKLKELCNDILSISQLSKIENGEVIPSADKFIKILSRLNVRYDEFILLMNDEFLETKIMLEKKLAESVKLRNTQSLQKLSKDASTYYSKYNDIYFKHVESKSLAMLTLISSNNDYSSAREHLQPIKEYLSSIEKWNYYELTLICNCLFMFKIEDAIFFGDKALRSIEENYSLYRNEEIACSLLINLAIYSLDYSEYYSLALKYSQLGGELAYTSHDIVATFQAKIIRQLTYFKLENGKFDNDYLLSLINTFKLLEWDEEFQRIQQFVSKHGIVL